MPNASQPLYDVLDSGRTIANWCAGRTFADYEADRQFRRAVEREFEIIGEALARLNRIEPELAGRIDALPRIIGSEIASFTATMRLITRQCGV